MALGLAMSLAWFFQCLPVASNFDWTVTADTCINFGPPRYGMLFTSTRALTRLTTFLQLGSL